MIHTSGQDGVAAPRPALAATRVSKRFGATLALDAVDLTIAPGEVRALLGANGSGKSTFIKILAGYHRPEPGAEIHIDGAPLEFGSADESQALGCRFVHQDLGLVPKLSVLDNLYLSSGYARRLGTIKPRVMRRRAERDLARVGLDVRPDALIEDLSPAARTGVAVARALAVEPGQSAKLLVLDEPTATLPQVEVDRLLRMIRSAAASGVGVLYVSHRIDEVFSIASTLTIFRDGRTVADTGVGSLTRREAVSLLAGSELEAVHVDQARPVQTHEAALTVDGITAEFLSDVSFTARPKEVLGFAGLTGSGRETVLAAVFGAVPREAGVVTVQSQPVRANRPRAALAAGVTYMPPDRKLHGGFMDLSAAENLTLPNLRPLWRTAFLRRRRELRETSAWFTRFSIKPADAVGAPLSNFSGGNQQKLLFSKWIRLQPKIFLLAEPTQGVDVHAKAELHRALLSAAEEGAAIVVSSTDLEELVELCHRVLVLRHGRIVCELLGTQVTSARLSSEMLGAEDKDERS